MKNILIIADTIVAKHFLERLFVARNNAHHYTVVIYGDDLDFSDVTLENFSFYKFDPTSFDKLGRVANGYFTRFIVLMGDSFEALSVYKNLRTISKKTEIIMLDMWGLEGLDEDSYLRLLDGRDVITTRLLGYLPDIPVVADNVGFGQGEIMEVKVPVGSSFMYRHINSITQKKWRIAMIYRGSNFTVAKPNLMILPNDTLLLVGEPGVLLSVFKNIKKESGQFPSPFGSNIYLFLDMLKMKEKACSKLIDEALKLNERLNSKRLYVKVVNPTLNSVYKRIKEISYRDDIRVNFDFFRNDLKIIKEDVFRHDVGLVVTDNDFFKFAKKAFFDIRKPVVSIGKLGLEEIKKGVVLSDGKDDLENSSAVILDCCSQLDLQISLYSFGGISSDDVSEHFDSLSKIFGKQVEINSDKGANPILKLKNEQNLLQFVPFSKKISRPDPFAAFSNDMNRLYARLSDNYQIFIPIN